ncbi:MAG: hypothetical protein ACAI44_17425 [Candidatus Sericytochromatia bacterium]
MKKPVKTFASLLAAVLIGGSAVTASPPAEARLTNTRLKGVPAYRGAMPQRHVLACLHVRVTGSAAWLKAMPSLASKTLRTAHHGESFTVVVTNGRAHYTNGWWLVRSRSGYRYWVHRSVIGCM